MKKVRVLVLALCLVLGLYSGASAIAWLEQVVRDHSAATVASVGSAFLLAMGILIIVTLVAQSRFQREVKRRFLHRPKARAGTQGSSAD